MLSNSPVKIAVAVEVEPVMLKPALKCVVPENLHPHHKGVVGNSTGKGSLKSKHFKAKYKAKLKFAEEKRSLNQKFLHGRSMDLFWSNPMVYKNQN